MTWRAVDSLLVLRGQADAIAPNRSRASDGLKASPTHTTNNPTSDHEPHTVPGVGSEIVTAEDLTHDPAGGFDSYLFAETLRRNRDRRIKYVISNHRMFSSYATSSYPAWTWRPYTGTTDPHTNHVHVSVLDAVISDTTTPWNLEGFMALTDDDVRKIWNWDLLDGPGVEKAYLMLKRAADEAAAAAKAPPVIDAATLDAAVNAAVAKALSDPATAERLAAAIARQVTSREATADRARADALERVQ